MKRFGILLASLMLFMSVGCMRAYDVPEFSEIETSETAFLVPLSDTGAQKGFDSEKYLSEKKIAAKKVQIPHEWVQLGRWHTNGNWVPTVRLIKVNRAPITVQWSKETKDAIWVESNDSVGFSTGIAMTARIPDDAAAIKFLYNYPGGSLKAVLDKEVRARVQKVFAEQAAAEKMDSLREKKVEVIDAIELDVVPFFQERGIEITSLGQFGGYEYENPQTQLSIDKVFQAQQDKLVAAAEFEAAEERKRALKSEGEGLAAKALESAKGEAEAIKAKADAKEYEAQKLKENEQQYISLRKLEIQSEYMKKWDGKLPTYMMGGDSAGLLMQMPKAD